MSVVLVFRYEESTSMKKLKFIGDGTNTWLNQSEVQAMKQGSHEVLEEVEGLVKISVRDFMPNKKTMWFPNVDFVEDGNTEL
tara:strand:+ start:3487 stop:3732 length:246 start_codon:yes stop_codon:yes gene_type:complete